MKKVGFFKSIHLKFIMIYVLLILIAMQVIGVYFIRQLEEQLVSNFKSSVNERVRLLAYNVEQEMRQSTIDNEPESTMEVNISRLLRDFSSEDITEVQVIDNKSRVIGSSSSYNVGVNGKITTSRLVKHSLLFGTESSNVSIDQKTGHRVLVMILPLKVGTEISGSIYVVASLEKIYQQMRQINGILATGTGIALGVTAILGIFLARTITRPMADMRKQALVMAEGDFSRKVKVYGDDEIGQLAMTFNELTMKLQDAQAMTEGERRKLSSVLANMTDGVIATDAEGKIILMNDPACEFLDVSRETGMGASILDILKLDERIPLEHLYTIDSKLLDFSDGDNHFIIKASFSVIRKDNDMPNGLITVLQDVTEQEKIENERKEFVANVSHELRTPLTTMRSYLEALADGAWQDERLAPKFLNVTQTETERMIRLVNDLLKLSKMDNKDYQLEKAYVDIVALYHSIIDRFEMTKGLEVVFERVMPSEEITLWIDQDKLTQVFDNIISNALKYSPEGGRILFTLEKTSEEVVIKISDEGVGIPKDYVSKIFYRFYRVDKARTRKFGGTGLGLAIAKEMIQVHGGEIWADSIEGKGTTITFTLPLLEKGE